MYRLESRWPSWAKWRRVYPKPHGERNNFDPKGLFFFTYTEAEMAADSMRKANGGDYRVVGAK